MNEFKKEEKKGGLWASLSSLFGSGSSASGGAAGLGSASGLGGLFATKAGIMGVILGGATIAAGVGVIYNFIGPASKAVYTPQLFQDTYYEEQSQDASAERAKQKESPEASASTLDMFSEQAKKEGLGLGGDSAAGEKKDASVENAEPGGNGGDAGASGASADTAASAPTGGVAKLHFTSGFGGAAVGGAASKMVGGGGMSGINGQPVPVFRSPIAQGKSQAMKGSVSSAVRNSSRQAVSRFNRKGAFGQARFAGAQGVKSAGSTSATGSRVAATEAFTGETAGTGEVGAAGGGVGLGGSGISSGNKLKSSDPSLSSSEYTPPPTPAAPENVSPWQKYTDMALYGMIAAVVGIIAANLLAKGGPVALLFAKIAAGLAMAAAALVMYAGYMLMSEYGQKWTGGLYLVAGGFLMWKAWEAMSGALAANPSTADAVKAATTTTTPPPNATTTPPAAVDVDTVGKAAVTTAGSAALSGSSVLKPTGTVSNPTVQKPSA